MWLGEGFEHAADRVTVAARKVQRIGEINQLLGDDAFVVELAFECFAQARASGDVEVDGNGDAPSSIPAASFSMSFSTLCGKRKANAATIHPPSE